MEEQIVYIDGGSRGNPGPSAAAFVLVDKNNQPVKSDGRFLGRSTNNSAEYQALIFALKKIKSLLGKKKIKKFCLEVRSDSELLVSQMSGAYKIEHPAIQQLFLQAWNLKLDFGQVNFVLIPRQQNKLADSLVNQVLDRQAKTQPLL